VALCPDRLVAVRRKRLRADVDLRTIEAYDPLPGAASWAGAVQALERFLHGPQPRTGELGIVLSNHFVRYLVIPWSERIASAQESRKYAEAAFEDVFGEVSAGWEICTSPEGSGMPRLAAAVDRALLENIRAAAKRSRLRLKSVQPYLMAAYNRVVAPLGEKDFIFMLVEVDRVCILASEGGVLRQVSAATTADDPACLAVLLERELQLGGWMGEGAPSVVVHCPHRPGLELPQVGRSAPRVVAWKPGSGLSPADADFAMVAAIV
jgi:hypothetical protein